MLNEQQHSPSKEETEFDWDSYITPDEQAAEVIQDQYSEVYEDEDGTVWF
jgi:hypothetical protein